MKFSIEDLPYIPLKWMQQKTFDWEYIDTKSAPDEDVYIKIARDRHYYLSCKRKPGGVVEYHFETRHLLNDCVDTFTKLPDNLKDKDKRYPLCQSEVVVDYIDVFIGGENFELSKTSAKTTVQVPALFKALVVNGEVKSFTIKNYNYVWDGKKRQLCHSDLYLTPRWSLDPLSTTKSCFRDYSPEFSGIQHLVGTNKSLSLTTYENGKLAKKSTHFRSKNDCFYNEFVRNLLYFSIEECSAYTEKRRNDMMRDLDRIRSMDPRYCERLSAFDRFQESWRTLFAIKTPDSYRL